MADLDPLPLSALQHRAYCPRQCGLIHREQAFDDNLHTLRGNAVHAQVDQPGFEVRRGLRVERALPLFSDRLGLVGMADSARRTSMPRWWRDARTASGSAPVPDSRRSLVAIVQRHTPSTANLAGQRGRLIEPIARRR